MHKMTVLPFYLLVVIYSVVKECQATGSNVFAVAVRGTS